jgi:hypothetical protein
MREETNPLFQVEIKVEDNRKHYILKLSQANLEYFLQGCPDIDRLVGTCNGNTHFNILSSTHTESTKEILPKGVHGDYFIHIGAPIPRLAFQHTDEEFQKSAAERYKNQEEALRNFKKVPIVDTYDSKPLIIGFVSIDLEKIVETKK